jgi:hypothetical protein
MTSLGTSFSHGIFIFSREFSSFFLAKTEIHWENRVLKLVLIDTLCRLRWCLNELTFAWMVLLWQLSPRTICTYYFTVKQYLAFTLNFPTKYTSAIHMDAFIFLMTVWGCQGGESRNENETGKSRTTPFWILFFCLFLNCSRTD